MIAREWKAKCPLAHKQGFIAYLHETGIKEASEIQGFRGAQVLTRDYLDKIEITLMTYWESLDCIRAFAGENIDQAKLYPEDQRFELQPDNFVSHYEVQDNVWL